MSNLAPISKDRGEIKPIWCRIGAWAGGMKRHMRHVIFILCAGVALFAVFAPPASIPVPAAIHSLPDLSPIPAPPLACPPAPTQASTLDPASSPASIFFPALSLSHTETPAPNAATARTIRVPEDYATITKAVASSHDGDIIEVADGFYFERNIVIDKKISLRSRRPYGAVVSGSGDMMAAVFIVRAACDISGFIIKNAGNGIIQRDSPDVAWKARNIAVFDCAIGISVNDRLTRIGAAYLENIIVDRCEQAISANDARSIEIRGVVVSRAVHGISGSNFNRFFVDDVLLWNCELTIVEDRYLLPLNPSNIIETGPSLHVFKLENPLWRLNEMPHRVEEVFHVSLEAARSGGNDARLKALLLWMLGDIFLEAGTAKTAEAYFQRAARAIQGEEMEEIQWRIDLGLGLAAEKTGNSAAAVAHFKKAIADIDRIGLDLPVSAIQADFRGDKIDIYEALIGRLMKNHQKMPDGNFAVEAFRTAEQAKARSLLSSLSTDSETDHGTAQGKEGDILAFRLTRCQLALQDPALSPGDRQALLEKLKRIEADREEYDLGTGRTAALPNARNPFRPESLERIRREVLGPSEALIEYSVGKTASYAFLLTQKDLDIVALPAEAEINARVAAYLKLLTVNDSPEFFGWEGGRRLWRILIGPLENKLGNHIDSLVIVPDGLLHYLPFGTLVRDPERHRFAIEDYSFRYAPSASLLVHLKARSGPPPRMDLLGLANPSSISIFGLTTGSQRFFTALPGARREIKSIAKSFPRERTALLIAQEGLEAALKELSIQDYRIIHFAVHGFLDDRNWRRSFLLLGADRTGSQDGFLQSAEIQKFRLNADLVVLSGCDTGAGMLERGEGIRGLSAAFLKAGARALVISRWAIQDEPTADFMGKFYAGLSAGKSKSAALREAKLAFLNTTRRHPFFWAPFMLVGG